MTKRRKPGPLVVDDFWETRILMGPRCIKISGFMLMRPKEARRFAAWLNRAADWLEEE